MMFHVVMRAAYAGMALLMAARCTAPENLSMKETQLTDQPYGHTLNAAQVFSPDDQWVVYDTRNEDTHIGRTGRIEKVHLATRRIDTVYETANQTMHGPGVGAAAWHPYEEKVIFIHGLVNSTAQQPYGFTRRFGAICDTQHKDGMVHAEARHTGMPFIAGALRGGTHAHTWSGDGAWISFTYNDQTMEQLGEVTQGKKRDLRTIGVMVPGRVSVPLETAESFSGTYFAAVAATVNENPAWGSDEIERAFDECWIGTDGYVRAGVRQKKAIAFQGHVRDSAGNLVTEVFVADLPADIRQATPGKPLAGTGTERPNVPAGLIQRRVTFTTGRRHAGIQGPRVRLRTSPDGAEIYFPMKDDKGVVQVFAVPTVGGTIRQVTFLDQALQAQFNVSPDGSRLSVMSGNRIWLVNVSGGGAVAITDAVPDEAAPVGGALWSHSGKMLVFNRYVAAGTDRFLQIFKIDLLLTRECISAVSFSSGRHPAAF